jgi:hypothetical protein
MAITVIRAQVTIPMDTAIPADSVVNTFHFLGDPADASAMAQLLLDIRAFYTLDLSTFGAITQYMSAAINEVGWRTELYNLADAEPRVPFEEETWPNISSGFSGVSGPAEISLVLSFQGDPTSGVSQARRRGRLFIGPLGTLSTARPGANIRAVWAAAGSAFIDITSATWVVYSPTLDALGATLLASATEITNGWVDDAWDVQRRRGVSPTMRTTFS